jgi:hypothetical protein
MRACLYGVCMCACVRACVRVYVRACVRARARVCARRYLESDRLGYTDAFGLRALRERIAKSYTDEHGVAVGWEEVMVTTGSSGGNIHARTHARTHAHTHLHARTHTHTHSTYVLLNVHNR